MNLCTCCINIADGVCVLRVAVYNIIHIYLWICLCGVQHSSLNQFTYNFCFLLIFISYISHIQAVVIVIRLLLVVVCRLNDQTFAIIYTAIAGVFKKQEN